MRALQRILCIVTGMVAVVLLAGCSDYGAAAEASRAAASESARDELASDCLDAWLDTQAPQYVIAPGMSADYGVIYQDSEGHYHANPKSGGFDAWCGDFGVPWSAITVSISNGLGCPYSGPGAG